jgi:peptide/nickel transport system substrate-binding protein
MVQGVRRSTKVFGALAAVSLVAAACGSSAKPGAGTAAPKTKTGGTVTFLIDETIPGFNVNTSADAEFVLQEVLNQVLPSAFLTPPGLKPALNKDLLTSAQLSGSGGPETIVYKINPKAVWSDGTPISADDFIYNWQAQSGKPAFTDVGGKAYDAASTSGYSNVKSVTGSTDGKTVTVVFNQGQNFGDWQALFSDLIPAHIAKTVGWNTGFDDPAKLVSGGPFVISNYVKDQTITETPNPKWYGAKPALTSEVFRILSDAATGPAAIQNGEAQLFYPTSPTKQMVDSIKAIPNVTAQLPAGLEFEHFDFNEANPYLAKLEVRQAIAYGTDRAAIIQRTVGQLSPSVQPLGNRIYVANQPQYVNNGTQYSKVDIAKAKSLLQSTGMTLAADGYFHPNFGPQAGQPLTLTISSTTGNQRRADTEQIFQAQMQQIGIKINIQNFKAGTFFGTNLPKGEFDIAEFAWVDTPFASGNLPIYCSYTDTANCGENWNHFANAQLDTLLKQAVGSLNTSQAVTLYNQVDKILWDNMATLPLFQVPQLQVWTNKVANVQVNTSNVGLTWNAQQWALTQ